MNKLKEDIENHLNNLDSSTIQISLIEELPEVNSAELEAYKADLLVKIESPLTLKYNNQSWTLNLKEHLSGLDFEKVEGQIMLAINDKFFDEYFQTEIFSKLKYRFPMSEFFMMNRAKFNLKESPVTVFLFKKMISVNYWKLPSTL
jgi:hypothetical protein